MAESKASGNLPSDWSLARSINYSSAWKTMVPEVAEDTWREHPQGSDSLWKNVSFVSNLEECLSRMTRGILS